MADQYAAADPRNLDSAKMPSSSPSSSPSAKTSGKCPQTHFLLCALTVAQVGLLSLFLLWTIKTCFTRYQRVFIVYPVDSHYQAGNVSNQGDINDNQLHSSQNNFIAHLLEGLQLDGEIIFNNESERMNYFPRTKRNFSVVGMTRSDLLVFTLNWLESLKRLNLDYDVTLIVTDQPTYDILSRKKKGSRKFDKMRLKASSRGQNGTRSYAGLSLTDCDVILDVLRRGMDVLWTDTDSVWVQDPMPLIWQKYNECDLWIQRRDNRTASSSFMFLKSSPNVISFVKAAKLKIMRNPKALRSPAVDYTLKHTSQIGVHQLLRKFNLRLCYLD